MLCKPELKSLFERKGHAHGWDNKTETFLIGGLTNPNAHGLYDLSSEMCLDTFVAGEAKNIVYSDEETDPLFWTEKDKDRNVKCFLRWNWHDRWTAQYSSSVSTFHIIVGPDLIKERAWETCRKAQPSVMVKIPRQNYDFNPVKVPNKISKPKIGKLKMACGEDMEFCAVPKTKFYMSNPVGQVKTSHKVELTRPYWITRYCITARQWREFAKYDCEGDCRVVEKLFPKSPICPYFRKPQWNAYCKYLNSNYSSLLPEGYVFRLPTEAEWGWAFVADKNLDVEKIDHRKDDPYHGENKDTFKALLQKMKIPKGLRLGDDGSTDYGSLGYRIYIGGRFEQNAFGVCDMICPGDIHVFDEYDAHGCMRSDGGWDDNISPVQVGKKYIAYDTVEVDPVHWDGLRSERILGRWYGERHLHNKWEAFCAHIVIAPELNVEKRVRDEELKPYTHKAFGGELLSDCIKVTDISSRFHETWRNAPDRWERLVSDEAVIVPERLEDNDLRGCHTDISRRNSGRAARFHGCGFCYGCMTGCRRAVWPRGRTGYDADTGRARVSVPRNGEKPDRRLPG